MLLQCATLPSKGSRWHDLSDPTQQKVLQHIGGRSDTTLGCSPIILLTSRALTSLTSFLMLNIDVLAPDRLEAGWGASSYASASATRPGCELKAFPKASASFWRPVSVGSKLPKMFS